MKPGYNFKAFEDDLIKPSFYFLNWWQGQALFLGRTCGILCFQDLTIFAREGNELCTETRIDLPHFFFSPLRLEGFQPAVMITDNSTM